MTLSSIQVTPANVTIPLQYSETYTATGLYSDSTTKDLSSQVSWSVAPAALGTISTAGVLTTTTVSGAGTVSATLNSVTGSTPVTVTTAILQSIEVTPPLATVPVGAAQQYAATGLYKDSGGVLSHYDVTTQPGGQWKSSNTAVATIDNAGVATGVANGTSTITFTLQSVVSPGVTLKVSSATLTGILIDETDPVDLFTSGVNTSTTLVAEADYSDQSVIAPAPVTWSLASGSPAGVVSVDATTGLVTALGVGTVMVNASYGGFTDSITVVVADVKLLSIAVSTTTPSVPLALTAQYTAVGSFNDNSTLDITDQVVWTVQDPIASVSNAAGSQGQVTPLKTGTTSVIATAPNNVSGSASLTITAANLVSIALTPSGTATLPLGFNEQFVAKATFTDNSVFDVTTQATWVSDNAAVASVSNAAGFQGLVSGLATGSANIKANLGSVTSPATLVTVDVATLVSITISPTSVSLGSNMRQQFTALGAFSDGTTGLDITKQVFWQATKQKHIVSISNAYSTKGLLRTSRNTKKTGTVSVKATLDGVTSNTATVTKTAFTTPVPMFDALGQPLPMADTTASADASSGSSGSGGVVAPLMLLGGVGVVWARRRRRGRRPSGPAASDRSE